MQRSPFSPAPFLLFVLSLLLLSIACVTPYAILSPTPTFTIIQTATPLATWPPKFTATNEPTSRPTQRPTSTLAPTQTASPTAITPSANWLVSAVEVQGWTKDTWISSDSGGIRGYVDDEWRDLWSYFAERYDLNLSEIDTPETLELSPTPFELPFDSASYSPSLTYAITCTENGLRFHRTADQIILREINVVPYNCTQEDFYNPGVSWTNDETAVAFVSQEGVVYIWPISQEVPILVGETSLLWFSPSWSPDNSKLMIVDSTQDAFYWTYKIAFRDGRPLIETRALIATRTESPPYWWDN
jgi:hypothetical protein